MSQAVPDEGKRAFEDLREGKADGERGGEQRGVTAKAGSGRQHRVDKLESGVVDEVERKACASEPTNRASRTGGIAGSTQQAADGVEMDRKQCTDEGVP